MSTTPLAHEPPSSKLDYLSLEKSIQGEAIIGGYLTKSPSTTTAFATQAINLPSKRWILDWPNLSVYHPQGNRLTNPDLSKKVSEELGFLLGGWFTEDLTPYIELYDSLVSTETKKRYSSGGMRIIWDEPKTAFYYLAFESLPWQVQATGEPGEWHAIFIGRYISKEQALQAGGHPVLKPLGDIKPILLNSAPKVLAQSMSDKSTQHLNVFDVYWENALYTVEAGVRQNVAQDGQPSLSAEETYFYGIRINIKLH
jgi:hypothetical protein